jgi:hypothetical protein
MNRRIIALRGHGGNGVDKKRTSHGYKKFFKAKSVKSNEDTENE